MYVHIYLGCLLPDHGILCIVFITVVSCDLLQNFILPLIVVIYSVFTRSSSSNLAECCHCFIGCYVWLVIMGV